MFIPERKENVIEVHVMFNKIIPVYSEIYYNEIKKLRIEVIEEGNTVESFAYLQGMRYVDDDFF